MRQVESLFRELRSPSHPDIAFSTLLERGTPGGRDVAISAPALAGWSVEAHGRHRIRAAIAETEREFGLAKALVDARYGERGLRTAAGDTPAPCFTVLAHNGPDPVGTVTVRVDGPAGLAADESHGDEIARLRGGGRRLAEVTRLAVDAENAWRPALAALFGLAYAAGRARYDVTDAVVEVNPRHARFYCRLFGFTQVGATRTCRRVMAPAVLLHLDLASLGCRMNAPQAGFAGAAVCSR